MSSACTVPASPVMSDTEADPRFSDICGENIELSDNRKRARWRHKYSAGRLFTSRPMRVDEKLEVLLDGSGHVGIGISKDDPCDLKDMRETGSSKLKLLTDIRVHKRECLVHISHRQENKFSKLDISYSGQKVVVKINKDEKFWLTFELKFGTVVIKMDNSDICFHPNSGRNIRFLDKERRSAKLDVEFPAVTCCLWRKIRVNEYITFNVLPLKDGEKDPSTYHLVLGVSQLDPTQLRSRDPESFRPDSRVPIPYRWKVINRFDKDVCYGEVRVGVSPNGKIRAFHTGGFEKEMDFDPDVKSSEFLFVLSLFRTEARIKDLVVEEAHYDYALQSFRKASRKYTESYYVDLMSDDVPVNCDQMSEHEVRMVKSRSYPMALPAQAERDERKSLALRPRQPSDNYYDDVAVGIPDYLSEESETEAVYCDVIDDDNVTIKENTDKVFSEVSLKSDQNFDKIDEKRSESPKVAKKKTRSPLNIRKPVSKLMDKVQGLKNVFMKRAEHPYDDVIEPEIFPSDALGTTLKSVPSSSNDVQENTYWEVMEVPRKTETCHQINGGPSTQRVTSNFCKSSSSPNVKGKEDEERPEVVSDFRRKSEDIRTKDRPNSDPLDKAKTSSDTNSVPEVDEGETGSPVNVKLLIQKFGGNDLGKPCAAGEKNPRKPLFHTSPSAPDLIRRSSSDETLIRSASPETLRCQSMLNSNVETTKKDPGLLTDTFDSINILLNIGKGKQRKNKEKQKESYK